MLLRSLLACTLLSISALSAQDTSPEHHFKAEIGGAYKGGIRTNAEVASSHLGKKQGNYTLALGYLYYIPKRFFAGVDIDFKGYQSLNESVSDVPVIKGSHFFYKLGAHLGYPYYIASQKLALSPYLGIGLSQTRLKLVHTSLLPTTNAFLAKRLFQARIGFKAMKRVADFWGVGLTLEGLYPLTDPRIKTNVVGEQTLKAKKRVNVYAELPIAYYLAGGQSSVRLIPYYETQFVGRVENPSYSNKAFSNYLVGVKLGYYYKF